MQLGGIPGNEPVAMGLECIAKMQLRDAWPQAHHQGVAMGLECIAKMQHGQSPSTAPCADGRNGFRVHREDATLRVHRAARPHHRRNGFRVHREDATSQAGETAGGQVVAMGLECIAKMQPSPRPHPCSPWHRNKISADPSDSKTRARSKWACRGLLAIPQITLAFLLALAHVFEQVG